MQRTIKIIVVWLISLFCVKKLQAQSSNFTLKPAADYYHLLHLPGDSLGSAPRASLNTLVPSNYYTQHFGFFCDKELKLEKSTGVPFRFRLGSIESTDKLEGKKK